MFEAITADVANNSTNTVSVMNWVKVPMALTQLKRKIFLMSMVVFIFRRGDSGIARVYELLVMYYGRMSGSRADPTLI